MDKQATILIVDDDQNNILFIKSALKDEYNLLTAQNGYDAINLVKKYNPDLVLLDIMMPDLDGYDVCGSIKADASFADIPIIFLTALDTLEGELPGLKPGGIDYLSKPVNINLLKLRIYNHLELKKRNDLVREQRNLLARQKEELANVLTELESQNKRQREAVENYQTLFREMLDGFALHEIVCDEQGNPVDYRFIAVNPAFERLTGLKAIDILDRTIMEVLPGAERHWIEVYGKVAMSGEPAFFENNHDGLKKHYEVTAFRSSPNQFACIFIDITERKQAEEVLRVSEERHRAILQTAMDGICLADTNGRLLEVNQAYCRMSGYSMPELLGMRVHDLYTDETEGDIIARIQKIITQGEDRFESRLRSKNGTVFNVEVSANYRPDKDGQLVVFLRDITARKKAEEEKLLLERQLHQAQKIESIGRLAGGVAHDFNNMLGVILGHTELLLMDITPSHPFFAGLTEIRTAAERSANLTRHLLAFARKQTITPKVLDLNETVAGMLKMLQRLIGENIRIIWQPGAGLWPVRVDPSQIDQILANLCVNARDAITDIGKLSIETGNSVLNAEYCAAHLGATPGEYTRIVVSDDGCGMDNDALAKIFEPFFTSKESGRGTGLGLSTVYGTVKQSNGFIDVISEPGQGTTFTIYLPRHVSELERARAADAPEPLICVHETILVVEDEHNMLKMTSQMLEKQGYSVLQADSPDNALHLAREHASKIQLLMTDVVMPGMNGKELAQKLLSCYPNLKILFMSGHTADIITRHGVVEEGTYFIQKPFSLPVLARKVRDVLDSN
jgi:PAS domain S-box-containing protein